jgi:hypothetical protein
MNLDKGHRSRILLKDPQFNKTLSNHPQVIKCSKCKKYNSVQVSPEINNINNCYFCGNPYYIIRTN